MARQGHGQSQRGTVTGYMLKLIRESIPTTQEQLATQLGVDRATVQSWESGRRPFTSVAFGQAIAIRHKLARLGADAVFLAALDDAAEADFILAGILDTNVEKIDIADHSLGWSVLTHPLTDLVLWAAIGQPPTLLKGIPSPSRRGPVPPGPTLEAGEQREFFANLQVLADRTNRRRDNEVLLHRQACFLAGMDPTGASVTWIGRTTSSSTHRGTFHTWSPLWPDARSVATSLAKQGDPELLRDFIARAHPDDACERAGLNYWAYWVGEIPERQRNDLFMTAEKATWRGTRLLRHLVDRLDPTHPFVDLNIHSLWALLTARRGITHDDTATSRTLLDRSTTLLDSGHISPQSQRELTSVVYSLRTDGLSGTGAI
ncbi:helix-turn-helix transcriptional regulator [Micromonospora sp. NPDC049679]|uniref:helix-turn-helix domain-containing protein n=1 Tax=Micromonospora sp. NPDC049679 TaxID=3155920 RepID=UPI0034060213